MVITAKQAAKLMQIAHKKTDELVAEFISEVNGVESRDDGIIMIETNTESNAAEDSTEWSFGDAKPNFDWEFTGEQKDVRHRWGSGHDSVYAKFDSYKSKTGTPMQLALGYHGDGGVDGFVFSAKGGSKRAVTTFVNCDDFDDTNETISMIKGGGQRGRSGFRAEEPLPKAYAGFRTAVLGERCEGKWSVQGVIVDADDYKSMLAHTALQARLRKLA